MDGRMDMMEEKMVGCMVNYNEASSVHSELQWLGP